MIKNTKSVLFRITLFITFLCLAGLILSGCSLSQPALSKYQTNYNFSKVSSYSFYNRNSDFSDFQNISDATRNSIELAIEQVLDKNGFKYKSGKNSDVIVTYHLVSGKGKDLSRYNKGIGYCSFCLRGGEVQDGKERWNIMPGSLIIDVIDPEKKRPVWRSVYSLKINAVKDNSKETQMKIYQAIEAMIKKYPRWRDTGQPNNA